MPKPLLPTLREKNRYIAFEVISDSQFERNELVRGIWAGVLGFLGEQGAGRTSLWAMDWDGSKSTGILRVNRKSVEEVRAAMALIKSVNNKNVIFHVLGVSGTLKSLREKFLNI